MLTVHIREFCQVSPGPLPHFVCGPGNEANYYVCKQGKKTISSAMVWRLLMIARHLVNAVHICIVTVSLLTLQ